MAAIGWAVVACMVVALVKAAFLAEAQVMLHSGDRDILLTIKNSFKSTSVLSTWTATNTNCSSWVGLTCDSAGRVMQLDLWSKGVGGVISPAIGGLAKLQILNLYRNGLSGTIPDTIGNLTNLQQLYLKSNQLNGSIPETIGNLTNLQWLFLDVNNLTGTIPPVLGNLVNLTKFFLNYNQLTGTVPETIGRLINLQEFGMGNNYLEGRLSNIIGNLKNLIRLYMDNNRFTGSIYLASDFLRTVTVEGNYFSGPLNFTKNGTNFCSIVRTNCLFFYDSSGGCAASQLQRSPSECAAFCNSADAAGTCSGHGTCAFATTTCNCDEGYTLALGTCSPSRPPPPPPPPVSLVTAESVLLKFKAAISRDPSNRLGGWTSGRSACTWSGVTCQSNRVTKIKLSNFGLAGSISDSITLLSTLQELDLSNNSFTGFIPASIGTLVNLQTLKLDGNRLTGFIPESIQNIKNFRLLSLANNLLIGPLTFDFISPENSVFNFSNNYLSGIPSIVLNGRSVCTGISMNCFSSADCSPQRDSLACGLFCNASQSQGACGGNGVCNYGLGEQPTCTCSAGYYYVNDTKSCQFVERGRGLGETLPSSLPTKVNRYFRYASAGYLKGRSGRVTWQVAVSWNWTGEGAMQRVRDQQLCNSCWIFAPISAIESAIYIANGGQLPLPEFDEQQILSCSSNNKTCTSFGRPIEALDYAAQNTLLPRTEFTGPASCLQVPKIGMITSFEQVQFNGWMGLLLILQQQPAIVNIEASSSSFINYNFGVYDDESCFSNGVDHSVVVAGYDLASTPPFWLLRNSWGSGWGDGGYMRLKITGGDGICGINSLPALMPVVKGTANDPCFTKNYAKLVLKSSYGPGMMNPCGNGECIPTGSTNLCLCSEGFVAVNNSDNTQTCAPVSPCTFSGSNPCGVGACLDSTAPPGTYSCACLIGYAADSMDGILTCITAPSVSGKVQNFTVPVGTNISCYKVYNTYGISKATFLLQNKQLNCNVPIPGGTVVNVTNFRNCSVVYAVNLGDTCVSIAAMFNISSLSGNKSPNPDLDCSLLEPFQQVCIERGVLPYLGPCTRPYDVQPGESCTLIARNYLNGNLRLFYALNPGVYCGNLLLSTNNQAIFGQQVCLAAGEVGASLTCSKGRAVTLLRASSCASLKRCFKGGRTETFKALNGYACTQRALAERLRFPKPQICVPKLSIC